MRKLLKEHGIALDDFITDKHPAYGLRFARRTWAERFTSDASEPTTERNVRTSRWRRRERKLQAFKSAWRFLSVHAPTDNVSSFPITSPPLVRIGSCARRSLRQGGMPRVSLPSCVVPESRGALSRDEEAALWQAFYTAAPAQRRAFEPSSKRRKRQPASSLPATG